MSAMAAKMEDQSNSLGARQSKRTLMITIAILMVDAAKLQYGMPATVKMFNGFKTRSDG